MSSLLYSSFLGTVQQLTGFVLSPLTTGPLLLAASKFPEQTREAISNVATHLPEAAINALTLPWDIDSPTVLTALRVLLAVGIVRKVNQTLSTMSHNSWRLSAAKGWNWPTEVVVITGGSSGIGKDIVVRLLNDLGVKGVAIMDIQEPPADLRNDRRVKFYKCDITSSEAVAEAANKIRADFGQDPSILINNAGVARPAPILETDEKFLRTIMGVNLMSHWFTTQNFLPAMVKKNKGHIITVASVASFVALPTAADYAATKAGALAFHETLSTEMSHIYKAPEVLTTVVHPNFVRTPLVAGFQGQLESAGVKLMTSDRIADRVVAQIKDRRGGQVIIPDTDGIVSGLRGWPSWLQQLIRDVLAKGAAQPQPKKDV